MGVHIRSVTTGTLSLFLILALMAVLAGCGSSGGGGAGAEATDSGRVGVLLSEAALDVQASSAILSRVADTVDLDYEHIWITITRVALIPASDEENAIDIYSSEEGCVVDLAELEDGDLLFVVDEEVPAGTYEKVRVWVSGISTEGGECDGETIKVPSGRIDFNPQGGVMVEPSGTLYVRLQIDAEKSFNLHQTGEGACIFRPVVFAEILFAYPGLCPDLYEGTVMELLDEDLDLLTDGFLLDRDCPCLPELVVNLSEETLIFSEEGEPADEGDLSEAAGVVVFGSLTMGGRLAAAFVKIGNVLALDGTVGGLQTDGDLTFIPDAGQGVAGPLSVDMSDPDHVIIRLACGVEAFEGDIIEGTDLRIIGLLDAGTQVLTPFAVLVQPSG